ncbi:Trk system potassium transporter TrkA [Teichococcus aestuarii]|uniref:Trk system potassium uptake protein TrkA n=1 Tax=Teichococcus aestuarii TaxID=568898 RepID=A0A2U1V867_9PROT|nr:Trk system potassium transporter TrkA [Pseudoroseomonas aestuarii]PWC30066.1 Trk system potassium transporter TrkA [Pseudoroseomonas aestuarii]
MRIIVCGAGQVGTTIARHLAREGNDVTVIDSSVEQARRADESYDVRGMAGHASHPEVLRQAGAKNADLLIAVTRSDEVNMVACQVAYSLFHVKRRIARLRHHGYLEPIWNGLYASDQLPVDVIISPELEVARGIARRLRTPGAFDMVPLADGRVQLLGIQCEDAACRVAGAPLSDLRQRAAENGFVVVALVREGRAFVPRPEDEVRCGDDVYVIAQPAQVDQVMAAFGHREQVARRLVIVGGGHVGLHLARMLGREALVSLKIIEHSPERAEQVARELGPSVVVLCGDALDRELLEEANIGAAETVIAVTNDDETNIFVSVLAKREGCQRAITLVNKSSYEPMMDTLGIDTVVSPSSITISSILRHVRRGAIAQVYQLRGDFGEVLEAEALAGSRLVSGPLGEIGLPPGMLVGAVLRGGEAIIPDATTRIEPGDDVIAVVSHAALKQAEAVLTVPGREDDRPPPGPPLDPDATDPDAA